MDNEQDGSEAILVQEGSRTSDSDPGLLRTAEGAVAFQVDDPLTRLVFNYGSFIPGSETYYGTPGDQMTGFLDAVQEVARLSPERALQYAAWQRDPEAEREIVANLPGCLQRWRRFQNV